MCQDRFLPPLLGLLLFVGSQVPAVRAEPFPPDPVEALRQMLRDLPTGRPDARELADYRALLAKQAAALRTPSDLGKAVLLPDWAPPGSIRNEVLADMQQKVREPLVERFLGRMRELLAGMDATTRASAAALLGELAASARKETEADLTVLRRLDQLTAPLVEQFKHEEAVVRLSAARALGQLTPRRDGIAALGQLLGDDRTDSALAVAAAEALGEVFQGILFWEKQASAGTGAGGEDFLGQLPEPGRVLVAAAGHGLGHADPRVRRQCLLTIRQAVLGLKDRVPEPPARADLPPRGAGPQPGAGNDRKPKDDLLKVFQPFNQAVQDQIPAAIRALEDKDRGVALAAHELLEAVGDTRLRLRRLEVSLAGKPRSRDDKEQPATPPSGLKEAVPGLTRTLGHEDVRIRLGALYVLETLRAEAAPAVTAVVKALKDDNAYVRWGAVRVLAQLAPHEAGQGVPALAAVLLDDDADVRAGAALALRRYGPAAREAVPKLAEVVRKGDGASRLLAIRTLVAVGTDARPALPALTAALEDPEAEVRAAAARAIGLFGPPNKETAEALRKALLDTDGEVRRAAGSALLADK
jgi:HEAT repeat protein